MGIFRKGNKAYSIFNIKCPKCHESDMFPTGSLSFKEPFEMKERCDKCYEDFFPEPGYYYGAMFLSYIFTAFFSIGFVLFLHWVLDWSTAASFTALLVVLGVFFVYIFRLARALYINMHVHYDPNAIEKGKSKANQKSTASRFGNQLLLGAPPSPFGAWCRVVRPALRCQATTAGPCGLRPPSSAIRFATTISKRTIVLVRSG